LKSNWLRSHARSVPAHTSRSCSFWIARALTDPEHILALADAARTQAADATAEMALADARLESAAERLRLLATERGKLTTALVALGALAGMEAEVATIRARLSALDVEQADLDALQAQASSRRGMASERAAFLRQIFTCASGSSTSPAAC
jgi:chromosome segregation ATPase